jgi:hypothetical protein
LIFWCKMDNLAYEYFSWCDSDVSFFLVFLCFFLSPPRCPIHWFVIEFGSEFCEIFRFEAWTPSTPVGRLYSFTPFWCPSSTQESQRPRQGASWILFVNILQYSKGQTDF